MKTRLKNKHRANGYWTQMWCALSHGRHPLSCDYSRKCKGDHVCTSCGWTGALT